METLAKSFPICQRQAIYQEENMIVYKYLHPDRVSVLSDGLIRFTQATALNDPFESNPVGTPLFKSLVERQKQILASSGEQVSGMDLLEIRAHIIKNARTAVQNIIDDTRNNKGILSLSLNRSELLMWSHYCDSHRGFVVGFYGLHDYFQKDIPDKRGGLRPVEYLKTRPALPAAEEFSTQNVANILLFSKSPHWAYEREMRMLHNVEHADKKITPDDGSPNIYLFEFPAETVMEVILGCQMPKLKQEEITALVKEKYPSAKLYQAEMSKTDFDLVIEEI